jgi:hypothetical protein
MLRFIEVPDQPTADLFWFDYPGSDIDEAYWIAKSDPSPNAKRVRALYEGTSTIRFKTELIPD